MLPSDYDEYAGVIDWVSHPALFPAGQRFIELVAEHLPRRARVVDVGGGTGAFSDDLLVLRSDLDVVVLEPSEPMRTRAAETLSGRADVRGQTLDDALPALGPADTFLFMRSLYALRVSHDAYPALLATLGESLKPGGLLCVSEVRLMGDRAEVEASLRDTLSHEDPDRFEQDLPVLLASIDRFREGVANREFVEFDPDALAGLFEQAGFEHVAGSGYDVIYRAPRSRNEPKPGGLLGKIFGRAK